MGVMGDFKEGIRSEGEMPGEHWAWLGMPGRGGSWGGVKEGSGLTVKILCGTRVIG